jgi:O-6-methylguanine DNA methyltransferase
MDFKEKVYEVVSKIPKGSVLSYGEVARLAGSPKAARVVGSLMRHNPYPKEKVPCHRVVRTDSSVGDYAGEKDNRKKIKLLREEGVEIAKGRIIR